MLWKHRDTGEENNKVERIPASNGRYEYIALFNASDSTCAEAWMGLNERGFAIMNTASYNIDTDGLEQMDCEGKLMTEALQKCVTVDDFEKLLLTHAKPLRVEANFGVIDADGNGAYFETNNTTFVRYDLKDAPEGFIVRTNYSHSGRNNEGYGFNREQNALHLLAPYIVDKSLEPCVFTEVLSKSYYHHLLGIDYTDSNMEWLVDQDFIPRNISTASCVIEGVNKSKDVSRCTMWISLGYPQVSMVRAAWCGDGGMPKELTGCLPNGHAPICENAVKIKHLAYPLTKGNGDKYLHFSVLYNAEGTGECQKAKKSNLEYYNRMKLVRK